MGDRNLKQNGGGDGCCDALDASADGIAVLDDGEYVYVNDKYVGIHGYEDAEELLGTEWGAAYTDEDTELLETDIVPTVREKGEWRGEVTGLREDGTEFPKEITVSLMEEGGFVCVVRDITERKERERELERYEAFVENSSDSITHMDEDGEILYRSPSSEREEDEPEDMSGTYAFEHIHPDDRERAFEKFRSLLDDPDKDTDSVEYRSERADGTYEWVEAVATDQRDTEVGGVVVNTRVIEERKKRQNELERYETFVENSSDIIVHLDVDGTVIYYSPSAERIMGHGSEERIGDNAFEYIHPEDTDRVMELFESTVEENVERAEAEFRAKDADGEYVWLEAVGTDQRDTEIGGLIVNIRDITERKGREKELEKYEAFIEHSNDIITHLDVDGTILYQSPSIERVLGYGQDETVGDEVFGYVHPDDREDILDMFYTAADDVDREVEFRLRGADGDYVWVEATGSDHTDTEAGGFIVNTREITERKKRERELERHEAFVENSSDLIVHLDEDGTLLYESPGTQEIFGHEPGINMDENVFKYVHPEDRERVMERFEEDMGGSDGTVNSVELRMEDVDGDYVWLEATGADRTGTELGGIIVSLRDITDRKEREKELERYEAFVKSSSDVITHIDEDGTIMYNSPSIKDVFGYGQEENVGDNAFEYVHPDDRERMMGIFAESLEGTNERDENAEFRVLNADGEYVWVEDAAGNQTHPKIDGDVLNLREITDRKEREKELREEKNRHRALVDGFPNGAVFLFDEDLRFSIAGGTELDNVELSPEDIEGRTLHEVFPEETVEKHEPYYRKALEGEEACFENTYEDNVYRIWTVPVRNDEGEIFSGIAFSQNITERKERERELERYEAIVENTSDVVTLINEDGTILYQSPSVETVMGYGQHERVGERGFDYIHPEDKERAFEAFSKVVNDPETDTVEAELRFRRADGEYIWLDVRGTDQRDTDVGAFVINARDISERKERDEKLRRNREILGHTERIADTGGWEYKVEEDALSWTEGAYKIHNLPTDTEPTLENAAELYHPEDREALERAVEDCIKHGEPYEEEARLVSSDEVRWIRTSGEAVREDGRTVKVRGAVQDVTERKKRERELERYESFIQNSLDIFAVLDDQGRFIYNSPSVKRILGYDPEDHTGEYSLEYVHPDDRKKTIKWFYSLVEGDKQINETELRYKDANGNYVFFEIIGTDQRDTEVGGIVFNARDITERKKRERELREEQQAMETVMSNVPLVVFTLDEDGVFTRSQGKALKEIGLGPGEAVGESAFEMYGDRPEITEDIEKALSGEPVRTKVENSGRIFETWYEPLEDEDGENSGVVGMAYDVTEREEREQELERYEAFIEYSSDVVTLVEEDGTVLYYSPSVEYHAGHSQDERVGDNIYEYIHPEDTERVMKTYSKLLNEPDTQMVKEEFRYKKDDGSYLWVESRGTDQRDTELGGIVVNAYDITERKNREKELERYEAIVENTSDVITLMDEDGTILYQSPSVERRMGYGQQSRVGENGFDYVHPDDRERALEGFRRVVEDPETDTVETELRFEGPDGSYVWLEARGTDQRDTEVGGFVVTTRDISERKEREQELRRNRELLRQTEQIADTGGWEYDAETEEVRWTDGTFDIHDVSSEFEATVENVISLYHPEDRERLREAIQSCIEKGVPYEDEFRIKDDEGEVRWIQMNGEPVSEEGETVKMRGAVQDVTERKEREQNLIRNRELLSQTERISDTGGWEVDIQSDELRWTEGTYELYEVPDDYEPTVENAVEFFHDDSEEEIERAVERCRDEGKPYDKELRLLTAEDNLIWVRTLGEPVYEEDEVVKLRGAIQDITERKEREREIKEQKDQIDFFNSLLRHDMLNSMTVIGGSSDILLEELPEDDERHELAERISKHSTEIVELTERVRSVLRRLTEDGDTEMSPADITEVIEERVGSLKETYPEVTCTTEATDEVRVAADPFLNHVIDNVLVNAVEHNDKEEPRVDVTVEEDEGTATIHIADNGPGVPDDEKEEVFKQGTTGRSSGSVGFGLYYVEQMVSEYGGEIHVEDNEPEGAVFVMEIPKAEKVLDGVETVAGGS